MPTATYIALANLTLTGNDAEVTFSSIPATYRDLVLVIQPQQTSLVNGWLRLNSDTGTNYSYVGMSQDGTTLASPTGTSQTKLFIGVYTLFQSNSSHIIQIMDYSATDKHKTILSRHNGNLSRAEGVEALAQRWGSTSAVTSLTITLSNSGNMLSGSTFALYGIVS